MVKYFHFHSTRGDIRNVVEPLQSTQCTFVRDGRQCKKRCQIGLYYCWIHLRSEKKVRIKDSAYGKGLFADNGTNNNEIVFKSGQTILEYEGEEMTRAQKLARYGTHTAPYGVQKSNNQYYDCGISRCAAGLINHKSHSTANSRFSVHPNLPGVRIKVQQGKTIRNGREIFVSYNSAVPGSNHYQMNPVGIQSYTSTRKIHH
jgi:hypothetical protein